MTETEKLQRILSGVGASKIIYALVMPETEAIKRHVLSDPAYFDVFREAWTQKQDAMHNAFFDRWLDWSTSITVIPDAEFPYRYPTAGASEGLRALIDEYGARARRDRFEPEIHIFEGEYEGFAAYAGAAFIPVIRHNRREWKRAATEIAANSHGRPVQLYLSQPSAIDGDVWGNYDSFMVELCNHAPTAELILDLTYVGCISTVARISAAYPCIAAVVFSLSKPMGAYYDRIGGVLARPRGGIEPYPALFGNKWFKNLTSLAFGSAFMQAHSVSGLPAKYRPVQLAAIDAVSTNLRAQGHELSLDICDVFLLAKGEMPDIPADIHRYLQRSSDGGSIVRVCLTPTMAEMIGTARTHEVSPRYYETL